MARFYLSTDFWLDFIATVPSIVQIIIIAADIGVGGMLLCTSAARMRCCIAARLSSMPTSLHCGMLVVAWGWLCPVSCCAALAGGFGHCGGWLPTPDHRRCT